MAKQILFDFMKEESVEEKKYTNKTTIVQYAPCNEKVYLGELMDKSKFDTLVYKIRQAKLPKDIEIFLIYGATRHIVFNFKKLQTTMSKHQKKYKNYLKNKHL